MANPNPAHRFPDGNKFGGRTPKVQELQDFCRERTPELLQTLLGLFRTDRTSSAVRLEIARLFLAYGYGKPNQGVEMLASLPNPAGVSDLPMAVIHDPETSRLAVELISRLSCDKEASGT